MNRSDFHQLVRIRLAEARLLLHGGLHEGAYYLSGYAVECALKACIAKQIRRYDFPDKKMVLDSHSHNLEQLLSVSGLKQLHQEEVLANPQFAVNWAVVRDWSEQHRYVVGISHVQARDLYGAVSARKHGILTWLKKHW